MVPLHAHRPMTFLAPLLLVAALSGCAGETPPPPTPAPTPIAEIGAVRTDGIYVARGQQGVGSTGGLVWPLVSPRTYFTVVDFLKFYENGSVLHWGGREPISTGQAADYFDKPIARTGYWASPGVYKVEAGRLTIVFKGRQANGWESSSIDLGTVGRERLVMETGSINGGPVSYEFIAMDRYARPSQSGGR
jgi:hypothetical protein